MIAVRNLTGCISRSHRVKPRPNRVRERRGPGEGNARFVQTDRPCGEAVKASHPARVDSCRACKPNFEKSCHKRLPNHSLLLYTVVYIFALILQHVQGVPQRPDK